MAIKESILAGKAMPKMAGRVTDALSSFSGWLILGFGTLLGLIITNIDKVAPFLAPQLVGAASKWFLFALLFHVAQRYLAAIVSGSVATAHDMEQLPTESTLDVEAVIAELERSMYWPARLLSKSNLDKIRAGDFAAPGRLDAKLTQIQGFFVVIQVGLILRSGYLLANAL